MRNPYGRHTNMDEEKENEEREEGEPSIPEVTADELRKLVVDKNRAGIQEVFRTVPAIDIAEAADDLDPQDLIFIFRSVKSEYTADFFDDLSQDTKEELVRTMTDKELVPLINSQAADDITDTVDDMPANLASRVLKAADKDMRKDINTLLNYKEETAGALMTTEYLQFDESMKVDDAIQAIREKGKDAETVYTIFVKNSNREFVGTVDLDDLIFAKADQTLSDIMNHDVVSCSTSTDQEEVGRMFRRYDLTALAVLNADQRLVGVITIDDAVDVMTEESSEDMARLTNMEPSEKPYMETGVFENAKKCFPWLMILLALGTFTTMVLNRLESQAIFVNLPILIAFVPTLMDTGGNAGGQTTGMMIRELALSNLSPKDTLKVLWKELRSGLIVAGIVSLFSFVWVLMEQYTGIVNLGKIDSAPGVDPVDFSGITIWNGSAFSSPLAGQFAIHAFTNAALIGVTMFVAITVSKLIGTLLPMGAAAIKKDPAMLSQPLLTTAMDVTTLLIYFGIACAFFPAFA